MQNKENQSKEKSKGEKLKVKGIIIKALCFCALVVTATAVTKNLIIPAVNYSKAVSFKEDGKENDARKAFGKAGYYKDAEDYTFEYIHQKTVSGTFFTSQNYTLGIKADGKITSIDTATGSEDEVEDAEYVNSIVVLGQTVLGLKPDGTVTQFGWYGFGQTFEFYEDVDTWTDIVAIDGDGNVDMVGLRSDVTVVSTYSEYDKDESRIQKKLSKWKDIKAISVGYDNVVGLKKDGTVVTTSDKFLEKLDILSWSDMVSVSIGGNYTVGLKSDGTVVSSGSTFDKHKEKVSKWTDIVSVSSGITFTAGLKSDGTVVCTDDSYSDIFDVENVVGISARDNCLVLLQSDGRVTLVDIYKGGWSKVGDELYTLSEDIELKSLELADFKVEK